MKPNVALASTTKKVRAMLYEGVGPLPAAKTIARKDH
jgi:hypothetical protein